MRTLTLLAMLLLAAACGSKDNSATNQVSMLDFAFSPESLNVSPGDTVTWVNNGAYDHTTTSGEVGSPDGNWDSGIVAPGARFSHVFTNAGDFHYYCALHAASYGMKGVVSVH
jgi:plastocyanin